MHWKLNTKIKDPSDGEQNLLRNQKWPGCISLNINKFNAGVDDCKSRDYDAKCVLLDQCKQHSKFGNRLVSYIDNKRKVFFTENSTKPFAGDKLKYFLEA